MQLRRGSFALAVIAGLESLKKEGQHLLIYSDSHPRFRSEFRFDDDMSPVRIKAWWLEGFDDLDCSVELFMDYGQAGYDLGISVPGEWWNKMKDSCPTPLDEGMEHPFSGYVKLTLAKISCWEFDYWRPAKRSDDYFSKTAKRLEARLDEHRETGARRDSA